MTKQWYEERGEELTKDLRRVADAMEEILRLVKLDQEKFQKLNEKKQIQCSRTSNGPGALDPRGLAQGQWLQATSHKRKSSSRKLDKKILLQYEILQEKEL